MLICIYAHYQGTILELLPAIKMQDILINVHETSLTGTKICQILYILYEVLLNVFEVH